MALAVANDSPLPPGNRDRPPAELHPIFSPSQKLTITATAKLENQAMFPILLQCVGAQCLPLSAGWGIQILERTNVLLTLPCTALLMGGGGQVLVKEAWRAGGCLTLH